ncbi:unnamed protein product [Hermetia illucens]|uniref:Uncharacterized protein n=2 Tax=Hermetia illucens TaxID=343691 RepID=A0A7R8Z023_HERIL|nr:unnamed protein product [Hermetia illucens]
MPEYVKLLEEFKKLQSVKTKEEMKSITTLGLISGALQVQKSMRENLSDMVNKLLDEIDMDDTKKSMPKIEKIENMLQRDERAILILGHAMDLARQEVSIDEFRSEAKRMMREYNAGKRKPIQKRTNETVRERLEKLRAALVSHMDMMDRMIKDKSQATIFYLEDKHGISRSEKVVEMEEATTENAIPEFSPLPTFSVGFQENDTSLRLKLDVKQEPIEENIIEDVRRQDVSVEDEPRFPPNGAPPPSFPRNGPPLPPLPRDGPPLPPLPRDGPPLPPFPRDGPPPPDERNGPPRDGPPPPFPPPPEIDITIGSSEEAGPPPPGGPIVGLIASLSGGDEGSDVGALVGALTGVVMNLFGPGGLDVPGLLSGGTALLAGLLSGDRNFGTVLGEYVGLTVDGFSGGGGAINNGRFFGNFLGTLIAELSADPEDDDLPPKPSIFIDNFLSSFQAAKSKMTDSSDATSSQGLSNSFSFITHIVRAIVGGVTSFILNASLGSSGGSSAQVLDGSSAPASPKNGKWG